MRKKCRCGLKPNKQSQTLIQQNIIIYNTTIHTHCSWSTTINTSDFCTIPAYLHALISSHLILTVHHRRHDTVCLRSIHQMIHVFGQSHVKGRTPSLSNRMLSEEHRGVIVTLLESWHLPQSLCAYISYRMTGKSTWIRGWSNLMIPWGIRFFWILFSLALFLPFLVTTVSS